MTTTYLQTRAQDKAWQTVGHGWKSEKTARQHLESLAANTGSTTDLRLARWEKGSPWDGISNPSEVVATRTGTR